MRVSGPSAKAVGEAVVGRHLEPRVATYTDFFDVQGEPIDRGVALFFRGPASFTGEHVVELQGHGGAMVMQLVLQAVLDRGARLAQPGEFTQRAFLNGKLDLAQAEAVADLIESSSEAAARGALRSLRGEFSDRVNAVDGALRELRVFVEAAIDFPDEEVEWLASGEVRARLADLSTRLETLLGATRQGALLRDGITVVLLGEPNVGKSSLLNALARESRAIVTEVPGTTRDLVHARVDIAGLACTIVDTAGLRETDDVVEREGVRRAREQARACDVALLVVEAGKPAGAPVPSELTEAVPHGVPRLWVENKVDLTGLASGRCNEDRVRVSALNGDGMDVLRACLLERVGYTQPAGAFTARQRHIRALKSALGALVAAEALVEGGEPGELLAEELRSAHAELGEIVGATTSDALLGEIFASFCIGK